MRTHAAEPDLLPSRSSRRQTAGQRCYHRCYIQAGTVRKFTVCDAFDGLTVCDKLRSIELKVNKNKKPEARCSRASGLVNLKLPSM